jgi:hypothetical protein
MTSIASTIAAALGVAEWSVRERRTGELTLETDASALGGLDPRNC